jgi:hypothetical protein
MDVPNFGIEERNERILVKLETYDHINLLEYLPFIDWYGAFVEQYPMTTQFYAPKSRREEVVRILKQHGFSEKVNVLPSPRL